MIRYQITNNNKIQEIKTGLSKIGLSARKMVKSISRINLNDDLLKSPSGLTYANRADSQSSLVSIDSIASIATPFESTAHGNTSIFTTPPKRKVPGSPANAFHSVRGLFTGKRRHRADTDHFNSSMVSKFQPNFRTSAQV